ncbi:hypothetical protein D9M69_565450 [compost metagenome]
MPKGRSRKVVRPFVPPYARKVMNAFEQAVTDLAFKGSMCPEDWEDIEVRYARAKRRMERQLSLIHTTNLFLLDNPTKLNTERPNASSD